MKKLAVIFCFAILILCCGCKKAEKPQVVFMPDSKTAETVNGYKTHNAPASSEPAQVMYMFNTKTKKFHLRSCEYSESCGENFSFDRDELILSGYSPCKVCNP